MNARILDLLIISVTFNVVVNADFTTNSRKTAYEMSVAKCKDVIEDEVQLKCRYYANNVRRRDVNDHHNSPLYRALSSGIDISVVDIPQSWLIEESEMLARVRRTEIWRKYELCCQLSYITGKKENGCATPDKCSEFDDD